jgi:hypothetical protein
MRSRTVVLFVVLAVAIALAGVYVGWSADTPKAVGEPSIAPPTGSSVGSTQRRGSGSGPARSPAASPRGTRQQTGSPNAAGNPGGNAPQRGHNPGTQPTSPPQPNTEPVRFGKVTTTPSDGVQTSVAPSDRRALTTTFDDVQVGNEEPPKPDATRSFSMTLPLTGGAKGETLEVIVQGMANGPRGASAKLTLKLNGQATVRYYRNGFDDTFAEVLEVPATPATTHRLEGVVEVHHDPANGEYAYLNVTSVDASIKR